MRHLEVTSDKAVLRVALNRPDVRNAFNAELIAELTQVFSKLPREVRVVVLSGAGKAFCAGADLAWMKQSKEFSEKENAADAERLAVMLEALDRAPAVVIGRVHGAALGGGAGLVACCDIVVAAEGTKLGFTEAKLGLVPAVISPFVLHKIGAQARRWFVTGELFDAERARAMGLVDEVVPEAGLDAKVQELVQGVLSCGPEAVRAAKHLIRDVTHLPAADVREHTVAIIAALRTSPEGQEGLSAFLEKRPPSWS